MISLCLFIIFALFIGVNCDRESKLVNTLQGPVRGYKSAEWDLYEFYGIPYATAPKGEDKFKGPLPPPTWNKIFDAVNDQIVCPQSKILLKQYKQDADYDENENCLVANILVSNKNDSNKPVLVYIHGGGYKEGFGSYLQPKTLVEEGNIIGITFNYRLGVEGFLCLGTEKIPGNAGLKDMVALLRWVRKNVNRFGGNPNDVTLAGYSAGSAAVDLLMISHLTSGLFHKVIPESGVSTAVWNIQQEPLKNLNILAQSLNFSSSNITDLDKFFTTASYDMLTASSLPINKDSSSQFVPCIESDVGQERFLQDYPLNILKKGQFEKLPMLLGHASEEGYMRAYLFDIFKDDMNQNFEEFIPADLNFANEVERAQAVKKIKEFYFGKEPVSEISAKGYIQYFGDVFFNYADIKHVVKQIEAGNENVYFYIYSFFDNTTIIPLMEFNSSISVNSAYHCAQSFALYEMPGARNSRNNSEDYKKMKQLMRKIWINFIKTGNPHPDGSTLLPEGWPPARADATPYMILDKIPQLSYQLDTYRFKFWDELYAKYYKEPIPPPSLTSNE